MKSSAPMAAGKIGTWKLLVFLIVLTIMQRGKKNKNIWWR
jgi:hypothetical protein